MLQTTRNRQLRANEQWPSIIRRVVAKNAAAREIMWEEVPRFVHHMIKLPIGPLNDDDEALRDIAVGVLRKLEANGNSHLERWLARQDQQKDHSSFWGFVKTVAWSTAIDYARTSRLNIAKRVVRRKGEPSCPEKFEWVRVDCIDSRLLGEVLGNPRSVLACGSDQDLEEALAEFQRNVSDP